MARQGFKRGAVEGDVNSTETEALLRIAFASALQEMTPMQLLVLWLRWGMGMTGPGVAEWLHMSKQAVNLHTLRSQRIMHRHLVSNDF